MRSLLLRLPVLGFVLVCAAAVQLVRADGEVGLVIEEDGQVTTYCIAYQGDGIRGDALLQAAGFSYEAFGSGSGATLCAIDNTGCFDPSSFDTCFCQCAGGADCTYWAFFTREYGSGWVYSTRAFDRTTATDGDLHAWRWGKGSPNSAPRPADSITFESVCGHAPRGGTQPTATQPPSTQPPATQPPTAASETSVPVTGTSDQPFTPLPSTAQASPSVSVTIGVTPGETSTASSAPVDDDTDGNGGGGSSGLIAFGAVAVALVTAVGGATLWRRRHGV